jgi:Ni2+-binding GTPase involved in maturation of urease and hydrogenase
MKVVICAGTSSSGKTTVLGQVIKRLIAGGHRAAYLKIDVQFADEPEDFAERYKIPTRKVFSADLCPDHCNVLVMGDAIKWAEKQAADILIVETAGLCLRCSPYVDKGLGISVLEATSGMNLPRKIGPMLSLADIAVVTKIDLISQAEREVFRARVNEAAPVDVIEVDALRGINIDRVVRRVEGGPEITSGEKLLLRGNPPLGTCTICVGNREIGWESHFGVVRPLDADIWYRGE